jgi:hypothetical protein
MAFLEVRLVAGFLLSRPLPMAARRLGWVLISVILLFSVTLSPFLLLLLLLYLLFTSLGIGGRRVTTSWPRAALRTLLLTQGLLHDPQSGGVVPSLGPPLSGGLLGLASNLHSHHLDKRKDMEMRDE